ncbi:hypothetical protein DSCO28_09310 [Desulfosarcina ovata subsp. sediminis]|uniref:Uncharacterized protein n=1 Tax=Desulfosarcina ovata subsp. sediminis TaxID=885957 RepID=A0A5K7ZJH1_9BACT|nr:hypothetical protein [Desulfosarcina ovata]BBO80365.1 hypothetical protein DSCO28_09310 [Desulfosarcina ovata subsp. sediminis]
MQAKTEYVDQMVKEILADISRRETKPSTRQTGASVAEMEDAFDMVFHEKMPSTWYFTMRMNPARR